MILKSILIIFGFFIVFENIVKTNLIEPMLKVIKRCDRTVARISKFGSKGRGIDP